MDTVRYVLIVETTGDDLAAIRKGMSLLAEWADAERIPISWALDARVARSAGAWLNERREGRQAASLPDDGLILRLDTETWLGSEAESGDSLLAAAERRVQQREDLPKRVASERGRVQDALPWANLTVAAADAKNEALIYALEAARFTGLWGYRWNEASPRAQDRGCPFGFFYAGRQRFQSAGAPMSTVVGVPRMTGDLSLWRRIPPEPSVGGFADNVSFAPLTPELDALRGAAQTVVENAPLNAWNIVVHPVNAARFASPNEEDGTALIAFWRWLREREIEPALLQDAVTRYARRFPETEPTALFQATEEVENPQQTSWTLFYHDSRAQFVFQESGSLPVEMCNYVTPSIKSRYLIEYELPTMPVFVPQRHRDKLRLDFSLDAPKPMPYALFLWGDHRHLRLQETNIVEIRWMEAHGILLLLDLEAGANDFYLVLSI